MQKTMVITPTYNERENIKILADKVFALGIPELKMVAVDDNSPDGTGELVKTLSPKYPIRLISRPKKLGLGPAYLNAFREILKEKPDYIIQMDADLSHDPTDIPELLKKIKECDLVVGSRYVKGGRIENWDGFRKLISRFGNFYARIVLGLEYRDLTSGFKCYRREVLENIISENLSSVGYNFQIETIYRAHQKGYKICETPITFTERKIGTSKFNLVIIIESFFKVLALRFGKNE